MIGRIEAGDGKAAARRQAVPHQAEEDAKEQALAEGSGPPAAGRRAGAGDRAGRGEHGGAGRTVPRRPARPRASSRPRRASTSPRCPATGPKGNVTKGDVVTALADKALAAAEPVPTPARGRSRPSHPAARPAGREERVKMTRLRKRIAERLKEAQNTAAMLTTFNEVDMTAAMRDARPATRTRSPRSTASSSASWASS